jgi:hypothetical protein
MKIIMFQYHREASAIISENTLDTTRNQRKLMDNSILAHGYNDRLLWEEAAALKPRQKSEFIIPGNWQ